MFIYYGSLMLVFLIAVLACGSGVIAVLGFHGKIFGILSLLLVLVAIAFFIEAKIEKKAWDEEESKELQIQEDLR